jgi:hypothetical protein
MPKNSAERNQLVTAPQTVSGEKTSWLCRPEPFRTKKPIGYVALNRSARKNQLVMSSRTVRHEKTSWLRRPEPFGTT